jgi:hypothetical protein
VLLEILLVWLIGIPLVAIGGTMLLVMRRERLARARRPVGRNRRFAGPPTDGSAA